MTNSAFSFPENPANGRVVTNDLTGVSYVYQANPGKWDVQLQNFDANFVNTGGDTMTGQLNLYPTESQSSGELNIKTFTANSSDYAFKIRNSTSAVWLQGSGNGTLNVNGKLTQIKPFTDPVSEYFDPAEGGNSGGGLQILGPITGDTGRNNKVLDCVYYGNDNPTRIRYFGGIAGGNDLVNKDYVDGFDVLQGFILNDDGGETTNDGCITIKQGTGAGEEGSGNLFIVDNTDAEQITLNQSGTIDAKNLVINQPTTPESFSATTGIEFRGIRQSEFTIKVTNVNDTQTTSTSICNFVNNNLSSFDEFQVLKEPTLVTNGSVYNMYVRRGSNTSGTPPKFQMKYFGTGPADDTNLSNYFGFQLELDQSDPNQENQYRRVIFRPGQYISLDQSNQFRLGNNNSITYHLGNKGIYFLDNDEWQSFGNSDFVFTIWGDPGSSLYGTRSFKRFKTEHPVGSFGLEVSGESITSNVAWNVPNPNTLAFRTLYSSSNIQGTAALWAYGGLKGNCFDFVLSKNNSSSSSNLKRAFSIASDQYANLSVESYQTFPSDLSTVPDSTVVTLGLLRQGGIMGTATYTTAGNYNVDDDNPVDTRVSTQTAVSVPAQLECDGPLVASRGFTLQGCTVDQPTNTSAICLQLYHPITAAAQLLYSGDTTSEDTCVQTKESVLALISANGGGGSNLLGSNNTFSGTNTFTNTVNLGNNSHSVATYSYGVIINQPSPASSNTGFNNGAIYTRNTDGIMTAGLNSDGLTTAFKLIFDRNVSTQDIMLKGKDGKGLNIKDVNNFNEATFATFARSGSTLQCTLDMQLHKLLNVANPTEGYDGVNKTYADSVGTAANAYTDDLIQGLPSVYATLSGGNTFTGGSSGEQKYSCSFTVNTNQIITFNSVLYHNSILYMSQSVAQQKVRVRGHSSKTLLFTSLDANEDEQNVLELGTGLTTNYSNVGFKGNIQGLSGNSGYDLIVSKQSTVRLQNYITRFEPNENGGQARVEACTGVTNGEWLLMVSDGDGNAQLNTSFKHANTTAYRPWSFNQAVSFSSAHNPTCATAIGSYNDDHQLTNKQYVDNKTASLKSTLHAAVNGAADFAALKAALLAALA